MAATKQTQRREAPVGQVANSIFIHGILRRSGTNYLNSLLTLHRDVEETPTRARENFYLQHAELLERYASRLFGIWSNPRWEGSAFDRQRFRRRLGEALVGWLGDSLPNRDLQLVTRTPTVEGLASFQDWFGDARLIIIVRDPRDVAESSRRTWQQHLLRTAVEWNAAALEILRYEATHPGHAILVRYEDLVANSERDTRELLEALGLDSSRFDWAGIERLQISSSSTVGWGRCARPAGFKPVGRWRDWTDGERTTYGDFVSPLMAAFGYRADEETPGPLPDPSARAVLLGSLDLDTVRTTFNGDWPQLLRRRIHRARRLVTG